MHKLLFLILILKWSTCQRRITNGSIVDNEVNTNFMAGLSSKDSRASNFTVNSCKPDHSNASYSLAVDIGNGSTSPDELYHKEPCYSSNIPQVFIVSAGIIEAIPGWLCGGSIIHPYLVLTSAACLHTVKRMYVIAGYRKYVRSEDLEKDRCTRHMRKRITYFCLHSEYGRLEINQGDKHTSEEWKYKWTIFDIGIARTDTPIDFFDSDYIKYCSYLPNSIGVNYHAKFVRKGTNVVVFGWGHADHYRPNKDLKDYNVDTLRYTSSVIMSGRECKTKFQSRYIKSDINRNLICADGEGNLDAKGRFLVTPRPRRLSCARRRAGSEVDANLPPECSTDTAETKYLNNVTQETFAYKNTRRNGICQNDHGSPLVRWIGGHPYIVGVASAFQVNKKMECVGPYLYTGIHCTSRFVHCVLNQQNTVKTRRASYCDAPDIERGFKINETYVNWNDDGDDKDTFNDKEDEELYD